MRISNDTIVFIAMCVFVLGIVWCVFVEPTVKSITSIKSTKFKPNTPKEEKSGVANVGKSDKNVDSSKN